ncbi:MAG: 3TM-type holin [Candidatus Nanopelagicus sp.]
MATLLAKKADNTNPFATNDQSHEQLVADPHLDTTNFVQPVTQGATMPTTPQPVLTQAGTNAAQGADVLVANDNSDWINKKWRPVMGWVYMMTCTMDFVIFPILWSLLQALQGGSVTSQWQPLTLQGAGLYHIAMGAVLGIAAYGRTKEKVAGSA